MTQKLFKSRVLDSRMMRMGNGESFKNKKLHRFSLEEIVLKVFICLDINPGEEKRKKKKEEKVRVTA